ncbi:hypothetical protein HU200_051131 [Digitaria exilis]|uniref:Uncharacterized protein n=1 Tax=Digitaria exilis TaxID=1010633 RepID=A0A835AVU2_9POAL|nr:hypothetical protein HU200_051131 [Digitaria exilis]
MKAIEKAASNGATDSPTSQGTVTVKEEEVHATPSSDENGALKQEECAAITSSSQGEFSAPEIKIVAMKAIEKAASNQADSSTSEGMVTVMEEEVDVTPSSDENGSLKQEERAATTSASQVYMHRARNMFTCNDGWKVEAGTQPVLDAGGGGELGVKDTLVFHEGQ